LANHSRFLKERRIGPNLSEEIWSFHLFFTFLMRSLGFSLIEIIFLVMRSVVTQRITFDPFGFDQGFEPIEGPTNFLLAVIVIKKRS
jgi:hypothetical protein